MRRVIIATASLAALMFGAWWLRQPRDRNFSGAVENGGGPFGLHGAYSDTMAFTPDSKCLAYIWVEGSYRYVPEVLARGKDLTLTEKVELRLRSTDDSHAEFTLPLDEIDLRPHGARYYGLSAQAHPSPDSRFVAALCSRRLLILELATRTHRTITYHGELFGSFQWIGEGEVAFSTTDGDSLVFWRANLDGLPENRMEVFRQKSRRPELEGRPPDLLDHRRSPGGRYVTFSGYAEVGDSDGVLLDLRSGRVHRFPFSLNDQCWKQDDSLVLVNDSLNVPRRVYLIDTNTGHSRDLSENFQATFGQDYKVSLVSSQWTPDGAHVILYATEESPPIDHGCVVNIDPFKVEYSRNRILRWSPLPKWVLVQDGNQFRWFNYQDGSTAPISGWVNEWTWAAGGKLAAKIDDGMVKIFEPELP